MISIKLLLVVSAICCASVIAAPQFNPYFVPILSQRFDLNPDGSYTFGYRSGDGSARDEVGALKNRGTNLEAMSVQGSYAYNSPAGPVSVQYIADENGFQPTGPGIHPAILKAVAQQVAFARANPYYNPPAQYNQGAYNPYFQG